MIKWGFLVSNKNKLRLPDHGPYSFGGNFPFFTFHFIKHGQIKPEAFAEPYFLMFLRCNYSTPSAFTVAFLFRLLAFSLKGELS